MSWYSKLGAIKEDTHSDLKRKEKWEVQYFKLRPGDRILYIEIGFYTLGGHTYREQYEGVILCTNKYQIQFRTTGYSNHKDSCKIPPELKVDEGKNPLHQDIILNKSGFQCLNTDTIVISDVFVSHLRFSLPLGAYWILAKKTFMKAYTELVFQKKRRCKYGKKCYNIQIDHLIEYKHNS